MAINEPTVMIAEAIMKMVWAVLFGFIDKVGYCFHRLGGESLFD